MIYYRVKPEYDQTPRIKHRIYASRRVPDGIFVANELYTARELYNFEISVDEASRMFEEVRIKKTDTYWFFGARFEYGKGPTSYGTY